jgi:hypothetical protein
VLAEALAGVALEAEKADAATGEPAEANPGPVPEPVPSSETQ